MRPQSASALTGSVTITPAMVALAARLGHQELANVVALLAEVALLVGHRAAGDVGQAADDDPIGHPAGVRVDAGEQAAELHWRLSLSQHPFALHQSPRPEQPRTPQQEALLEGVFGSSRNCGMPMM